MTRSVIREHIFKLLFRVEFHDAHELDGQIRLYMNGLGTISEADCKYITEKTQTIAALLPEIDEKINSVSEGWPVNRLGKAELATRGCAHTEHFWEPNWTDDKGKTKSSLGYDYTIPGYKDGEYQEYACVWNEYGLYYYVNGVLAKLAK